MSILETLWQKILPGLAKPRTALPEDARAFIGSLATSENWILAVGIRGTPLLPKKTEAALETITEHRMDVAELGDDDSVFPFNYEEAGKQLLPFFTTEERARQFASDAGVSVAQIFQPFPLLAGFVAAPENHEFDLILDSKSSAERRISEEERRLLRALSLAEHPESPG